MRGAVRRQKASRNWLLLVRLPAGHRVELAIRRLPVSTIVRDRRSRRQRGAPWREDFSPDTPARTVAVAFQTVGQGKQGRETCAKFGVRSRAVYRIVRAIPERSGEYAPLASLRSK